MIKQKCNWLVKNKANKKDKKVKPNFFNGFLYFLLNLDLLHFCTG